MFIRIHFGQQVKIDSTILHGKGHEKGEVFSQFFSHLLLPLDPLWQLVFPPTQAVQDEMPTGRTPTPDDVSKPIDGVQLIPGEAHVYTDTVREGLFRFHHR